MSNEEMTKLILEQKEVIEKMKKSNKSMFIGLLFNDIWTLVLTILIIWMLVR